MTIVENALTMIERELSNATDEALSRFIVEWHDMDGWAPREKRLGWWVRPRARREQTRRLNRAQAVD